MHYRFKDRNETLQWLRLNSGCKWTLLKLAKQSIETHDLSRISLFDHINQLPPEVKLLILENLTELLAKNIPNTQPYWINKQRNLQFFKAISTEAKTESSSLCAYVNCKTF